jgi:hypothetical protein
MASFSSSNFCPFLIFFLVTPGLTIILTIKKGDVIKLTMTLIRLPIRGYARKYVYGFFKLSIFYRVLYGCMLQYQHCLPFASLLVIFDGRGLDSYFSFLSRWLWVYWKLRFTSSDLSSRYRCGHMTSKIHRASWFISNNSAEVSPQKRLSNWCKTEQI